MVQAPEGLLVSLVSILLQPVPKSLRVHSVSAFFAVSRTFLRETELLKNRVKSTVIAVVQTGLSLPWFVPTGRALLPSLSPISEKS